MLETVFDVFHKRFYCRTNNSGDGTCSEIGNGVQLESSVFNID